MWKMPLAFGWIAVLAIGLAGGMARGQTLLYDPNVEAAIERYRKALLDAQVDDHWPAYEKQETGPTALAVYALLEAGVKPQEPNLAAALKWLTRQKEEYTYS
ncbi:MAG: hypothetical protein NT031_13375, partial [Planctomycetota bacterium]|nr:hypothetical protein [Planctomycetota bacterium]